MNNGINTIIAASRFAIAAAIVYFAYQLAQINDNVSVAMALADQVSKQIEPALLEAKEIRVEIAEVRKLVPDVLAEVSEVRKQIPVVVNEIARVRQQIPPVLDEVEQIRGQIPPILAQLNSIETQIDPILKRIDKTVAVVDKTQRQIPQIIDMADNAIASLNQTRGEVVLLVPPVLDEIRLTREKIDPSLDRLDDLVEDAYFKATDAIGAADKAGQEASEGVVKGFFTGLIKLPFELVGTLASPIVNSIDQDVAKQLTEKDIELMIELGNRAYKSARIDKEYRWENSDSGNSGSITLLRQFQSEGRECTETRVTVNNKRKEIMDEVNNYCLDAEGKWSLVSSVDTLIEYQD